jgi:hypothetical protein
MASTLGTTTPVRTHGAAYTYAVTALDRVWNESVASRPKHA